ncbi:MAG: hypothetical protein KIY10_10725, partial [Thermoplasmata archaeon]|nr:hypothetical protein [Candidatus Sysuiplasma jiujiangense]
ISGCCIGSRYRSPPSQGGGRGFKSRWVHIFFLSDGSRSDAGAETTGKLASVFQTLRKKKMDL